MSRAATHALIGAVGGLTLTHTVVLPVPQLLIVGGSALLALWPDIDEPNSWMGRRVRWLLATAVTGLLALMGSTYQPYRASGNGANLVALIAHLRGVAIGLVIGAVIVGPLVGWVLLRLLRWAAGGHRYGTHSLVVAGCLLTVSDLLLVVLDVWPWLGVACMALAWGQCLHVLGDLVTPSGVAVCWPLSHRRFAVLPQRLRPWGEGLLTLLSVLVGMSLLLR